MLAKLETLERCLARIGAAQERAGLDALDRLDIVDSIVRNRLGDLRAFAKPIVERFHI